MLALWYLCGGIPIAKAICLPWRYLYAAIFEGKIYVCLTVICVDLFPWKRCYGYMSALVVSEWRHCCRKCCMSATVVSVWRYSCWLCVCDSGICMEVFLQAICLSQWYLYGGIPGGYMSALVVFVQGYPVGYMSALVVYVWRYSCRLYVSLSGICV